MSLTRSYNPIWEVPTLTGAQMDDRYYFFTLQNTLPYLPQNIFQDQNGLIPWSNPIEVLASGSLPENMYWDDTLVYRLEWRAGPTQADALIWEVNNYVPIGNEGPTPPPGESTLSTDNQITNPQFSILNFSGTFTTTSAGTFDIAPGWQIITAGSGTVTVTQDTYEGADSNSNSATNASYGLSVTNNGFTSVILRQRFNHNGALWTGATGAGDTGPGVAINLTASSDAIATIDIEIKYSDTPGPSDVAPIEQELTTSNVDYAFTAVILQSFNTDPPATAWTDFDIVMTTSTTYHYTSIQLLGQEIVEPVSYLQTTLEWQEDHTFHYYNDKLQFKPIPSLLAGWDFPLNPCQELGTGSLSVTTTSGYVWDQTIMATSASTATAIRDVPTGNLLVTTGAATQAFYLLQYLADGDALKTTLSNLSVNINAYSTVHDSVVVRCYLYNVGLSAGAIPTSATGASIGTVAASGVFTLSAAGWTALTPFNGVVASQTLSSSESGGDTDIKFISYDGLANYNADVLGNAFAIVVTFSCPTSGTVVNINSISCVPGDIATRPAPLSASQTLQALQYYYEKSYNLADVPGTVTANAALVAQQNAGLAQSVYVPAGNQLVVGVAISRTAFGFQFNTLKRSSAPTVTIYSKSGASANVYAAGYRNGSLVLNTDVVITAWTQTGLSSKSVQYLPASPGTALYTVVDAPIGAGTETNQVLTAFIEYQYVVDARLGIV